MVTAMANTKKKVKASVPEGATSSLKTEDMTVPRDQTSTSKLPISRVSRRLGSVQAKLDGGPDVFLSSRQGGSDLTRECLASLYKLASSMHSRQLTYYSKSLETSRARHVTLEQIWGQMSMLLPPVFRRLRENVRRAQKMYGCGETQGSQVKQRSSDNKSGNGMYNGKKDKEDNREDDVDASSAHTSQLNESDLDNEIAELLAKQREARERRKRNAADDSWRYVFGKGDGEEDADAEGGEGWSEGEEDREDGSESGNDNEMDALRGRRKGSRDVTAPGDFGGDGEDADDEEKQLAQEELEALKEMYGEDFVPNEEDEECEYDDGEGDLGDDDQLLEEDLKWDDPSAVFSGKDAALKGEGEGWYDAEDDILAETGQEGDMGDDMEDNAALNDPSLTELQRERLRERRFVEKLEQARLYSTQWAMSGEVSGSNRPRDALLDEALDFEYAMKAVPVISEGFTAKLEDRIRRRIVDNNYDDVQRRTALSTPSDLASMSRRDDASAKDSEKARMSLMDLYEKEYLDRVRRAEESAAGGSAAESAEPLTEIEKDELRAIHMWRRLAQHLDALSNFHYTPKPVQEDLSARVRAVEGQAPAITFETVGNFATTREAALAPQDLYRGSDRKFADVGVNELQPHERRALRRAKKEQVSTSQAIKEKHKERAKRAKEQLRKAAA
ncbi:U3 small nucleolar ribonucleoprotein MPP10 [Trypanosoma brucei equiperdum]|uniref:U3 small nucleolar ribonucleoprotein MPP10 n=1 Tax=Trypanosoma brucei equiperdum TaxID=630700 RepID=A0A3L6LDW5_9TRYP|nr:U3 small nucleolar ribonucleoprotein MPP10 [Trypanosoma brucei equiperdum]